MKLKMYTDGACRGNPGMCGVGVVLKDEWDRSCSELRAFVGLQTNNQAEYLALIHGLLWLPSQLAPIHPLEKLEIYSDSRLMVMQLVEQHRIRAANLRPLHTVAKQLLDKLPSWELHFVHREQNREADKLASEVLDELEEWKL